MKGHLALSHALASVNELVAELGVTLKVTRQSLLDLSEFVDQGLQVLRKILIRVLGHDEWQVCHPPLLEMELLTLRGVEKAFSLLDHLFKRYLTSVEVVVVELARSTLKHGWVSVMV